MRLHQRCSRSYNARALRPGSAVERAAERHVTPFARALVAARGEAIALTTAVAAVFFWLAYDGGTYGVPNRTTAAVLVWWGILVAVAVRLWPLARVSWAAPLVGGLIATFAVWSAASAAWGASAEDAFTELNRVTLYVGTFTLAVVAATRATVRRWTDGIAVALACVAAVALASRLFPGLFSTGVLPRFLPEAHTRLSWPVNYWNGLAILVALGCPLLLRIAVEGRNPVTRAAAVAPIPIVVAVVYLASSRTGAVATVLGCVTYFGLSSRRWTVAGAVLAAAAGSAGALGGIVRGHELVNGPLGSSAAASQGHVAAGVVVVACAGAAVLFGTGVQLLEGRVQPPQSVGWAAVVLVLAFAVAGVTLSHPVRRFEDFKRPPSSLATSTYIRSHLLSTSGNYRWQFWHAAVDEFRAHPVAGGGAGSFERWWAQHGLRVGFVGNAHSLYLQGLAELGVVGLALLAGAFVGGLVVGARRLLRAPPGEREVLAALLAAFVAYGVAAGVDWMWQLTVVSLVAMTCLGLVVGPATDPAAELRPASQPRVRLLARLAVAAVAVVALVVEADLLAADLKLHQSQAAAGRGDLAAARSDARTARRFEPWASSPYLQAALVAEQGGNLRIARRWIDGALDRDASDWRLWLVSARIETELGHIGAARRSLHRAIALNPRSPIFSVSP